LCVFIVQIVLLEEIAVALYGRDDLAWDELARPGLSSSLSERGSKS
jgi:hypothetical protein